MTFASYPSLRGKSVLVTGGASGIGADIVSAFHAQGAQIGFIDILDDAAKELCEQCDGKPIYRHCDITDISSLKQVLSDLIKEMGPVTILINNAANDKREEIDSIGLEEWDKAQAINLRPQFFAAQAVRADMAKAGGGSIINMSSISWKAGPPNMTPYVTAKAGIIGMTKSLAGAFGADNIRVNAIEPGAVMTERQRATWYTTQESVDSIVNRQAIKRVLLGDEIARTILFLASDDARMITKQTFTVDAGLSS